MMLLLLALFYTSTFALHTHSLGRFWVPWIRMFRDFWTPYIVQVFVWSYTLQRAGVSLFLIIGILTLLFMLFPNSIFIASSCHFLFYSSDIIVYCVRYLYVILQWYWYIIVDFITCSGYFRLSVYAWGIFLAYIRRRPSSRLRFRVFWEAGRDTYALQKASWTWISSRLWA